MGQDLLDIERARGMGCGEFRARFSQGLPPVKLNRDVDHINLLPSNVKYKLVKWICEI